ncbi:general odorant-binding protein 83a-like [Rhodnius prolixus]|uniref:Uncharacterized protein n=2 Tax=Rhodnius prolixus TaxID=13249 RepID=T1H7Y5_RHOPR
MHPLTLVLGAVFYTLFEGAYAAVELSDDMKEMAKMLHDQCIDESGVNGALIEPCAKGDFSEDGNLKCYFKCIFANMGALSDDGELDAEAFESILPPDLHDPLSKMINSCKDAKGANACEVAFNFNKCLYNADPEHFLVI